MESTIEKSIKEETQADGKVVISYRSDHVGTRLQKMIGGASVLGGAVLSLPFFMGHGGFGYAVMGAVLIFVGWKIFSNANSRLTNIEIIPSEGIIFNRGGTGAREQIPYRDIDSAGTNKHGMVNNDLRYAYVEVGGTHVAVTEHIQQSTAEAIDRAIKRYSGHTWS